MSDTIGIEELFPGDVLLYRGTSFVSRAIQFFDGSDLSHAALYLGNHQVGEAVAHGLVRRDIHTSLHGNEWVKAYRLKDRPADMSPVLLKGAEYLDQGNRYGYEQLLLLAFLCLTRKLKMTPALFVLVRRVLDASAAVLTRLLSENREPMICSEFVFRAYDEALPEIDDAFSLRINELVLSVLGGLPAARGEAPLYVPRGQGVHPESLLAFLSTDSSSVWLGGAAAPAAREGAVLPEVDEAAIDASIADYLAEVREEPAPGERAAAAPPEGATVEDLRAASARFASALFAVTHGEPVEAIDTRAALAARSPINVDLFRTAADFVTPADLYRTQSLFVLGPIES